MIGAKLEASGGRHRVTELPHCCADGASPDDIGCERLSSYRRQTVDNMLLPQQEVTIQLSPSTLWRA